MNINLLETVDRIKTIISIINEQDASVAITDIRTFPEDPYVYAKKGSDYLTYRCGKKQVNCPDLSKINWINVTQGRIDGKPSYDVYENAIKEKIYNVREGEPVPAPSPVPATNDTQTLKNAVRNNFYNFYASYYASTINPGIKITTWPKYPDYEFKYDEEDSFGKVEQKTIKLKDLTESNELNPIVKAFVSKYKTKPTKIGTVGYMFKTCASNDNRICTLSDCFKPYQEYTQNNLLFNKIKDEYICIVKE